MVINQKFFGADSIFSIITTVVMVFVSIFTAGSAICIAWTLSLIHISEPTRP